MGQVLRLRLSPELALVRATRGFLAVRPDSCPKCGSRWLGHEPAFVRCRYCGALSRIASASLADQELFEIRSGLRLAS